jgi:hypothetical protein
LHLSQQPTNTVGQEFVEPVAPEESNAAALGSIDAKDKMGVCLSQRTDFY